MFMGRDGFTGSNKFINKTLPVREKRRDREF
jgi:hypothetical protein